MDIKPAILIVDDDVVSLNLLSKLVETMDYQVFAASHGEEALQILRGRPIDLVVSDYEMPGLDGLNLLKQAKQEFPRLPFILVTAYSNLKVVREAWQHGAFDFFQKPVFVDRLHQTIRLAIEYGHLSIARRKFPALSENQPDPHLMDLGIIRELSAALDREALLHIVEEYETHARIELEQILRYAMIKDSAQLKATAHRLAGSSTNLGLVQLTDILKQIENAPDSPINDPGHLEQTLERSIYWLKNSLTQIFQEQAS